MLRFAAAFAALATAVSTPAVEVVIDYSFAPSFFSNSTTNGRQARATVEAAADFFSSILDDTLAPIQAPPPFQGVASTQTWSWSVILPDPTSSGFRTLNNLSIGQDEFRIYVGAHAMGSTTLGAGSFGTASWSFDFTGPGFLADEFAQINTITDGFADAVENRGETNGGFNSWGGAVKFNPAINWHYDHTTPPPSGRNDLLSVALHEMGHALGFGVADEFKALRSSGRFTGAESRAANDGVNPRLDASGFHWRENDPSLRSPVFGGGPVQEPSFDPVITTGTRKRITELDAAALDDIGWEVVAPPILAGDFNTDGRVDAADYTVWRDTGGPTSEYNTWKSRYGASGTAATATVPEPGAATIACLALGLFGVSRWRHLAEEA